MSVKLLFGDCFQEMDKLISENIKVDMILTDLPYGVTACDWDKQVNLELMWDKINKITNKNSAICLFSSQPFTTDLINSNRKYFKYCWYWIKNQGTNFFHAKRMPIRKVEEILIFYKKQPKYNIQFSDGHKPTNSAKGCSNGIIYYGNNKRNYEGCSTKRYPTNLLQYNCVNNYTKLHPIKPSILPLMTMI